MSFTLRSDTGITILPSPVLSNTEALSVGLEHGQSMSGDHYTYVRRRSADKREFSFTFENVGRGKLVEVQEFFKLFNGERIFITDHQGTTTPVYFQNDAVEFTIDRRSGTTGASGERSESGNFTLNFIEV